jgi:hypothetical protein
MNWAGLSLHFVQKSTLQNFPDPDFGQPGQLVARLPQFFPASLKTTRPQPESFCQNSGIVTGALSIRHRASIFATIGGNDSRAPSLYDRETPAGSPRTHLWALNV